MKWLVSYREPEFSRNEINFCETEAEARELVAEYSNDLPGEGKYALELFKLDYQGGSSRGGVGLIYP